MSQLSDFIKENNITPEAIVAESGVAEHLSAVDRKLYVQRSDARRNKKSYDEVGLKKPGGLRRGVSMRILRLALDGQPITRINRKKITKAVENLLKNEVEVSVFKLFSDVRSRNHKKPDGEED